MSTKYKVGAVSSSRAGKAVSTFLICRQPLTYEQAYADMLTWLALEEIEWCCLSLFCSMVLQDVKKKNENKNK